jgi:cytochrome c
MDWEASMRYAAVLVGGLLLSASQVNAQDVDNGEAVFKKCRACHQVGPTAKNGVGPHLNGLFGRKSGTVDGFAYSDANKSSGTTWDETAFKAYIKDPRAAMPGNKMAFAGLSDEQDVTDLIAYLHTFDGVAAPK